MNKEVKNKGGRPSVKYPYLWEMYHIQWEKGDITQRDMMSWLNLKKTTLYKLSKQYKKELYKGKNKNVIINYEKNVREYILKNKGACNEFDINHNEMKKELKLSSPTILKIIKRLEDEHLIIKLGIGVWKILFK